MRTSLLDLHQVTFNVLRDLVKIEGIAFRCERNVQELIERL